MDHSMANPSKNSFSSSPSHPTTDVGLVSRRKKSKVTRSQINDFHAAARNEEEDERSRINSEERNAGKSRNRYHVCKHCNRSFTSGRALGGHIRIHGASFKGGGGGGRGAEEESHNSLSMEGAAEVDGSDSSDADSSGSSEGGLSSPKMVSLYTLRNNPKRSSILMDPEFTHDLQGRTSSWQWQESVSGILPPLPYSSEYVGSQLRHRRLSLPNWSMTRSRSSRSSCNRAEAEPKRRGGPKDVGADHDERDTAHLLVMLARRTRSNNNNEEEERESTEESVYDSKPRIVSNLESQGSIEDLGGSGGEESRLVQKRRRKKKRNSIFESDVDGDVGGIAESTQHQQQHQCNTCKKVFNSHQALGGHRASHRKVKGCFAADGAMASPLQHFLLVILLLAFVSVSLSEGPFPPSHHNEKPPPQVRPPTLFPPHHKPEPHHPSPFIPKPPPLHKPPFEKKPLMKDAHPPTLPKPQPHHPSPFVPKPPPLHKPPFENKPPMKDGHPPILPKPQPQPHHPSPFTPKPPPLHKPPFEKKPTMKDGHFSFSPNAFQSPPLPKVKSPFILKPPPLHSKVPPHNMNDHPTSFSHEKPHPPFHKPIFNTNGQSHPPMKKSPPKPIINPPPKHGH